MLTAALVAAVALVVTALLTPVVRAAAIGGGMVRGVQEDRWHTRPTPAIGGVAIFVGFGTSVALAYAVESTTAQELAFRPWQAVLQWTPWVGLVVAATIAFLVGLLDDFVKLSPGWKLLGQSGAAAILLLSGIGVWLTGVYWVDVLVSMFWFIGITNALNLLDNMDGLAGGVAAIAGLYLAVLFGLEGSLGLATLAVGFSAALVGFLAHNYPPARIFMGDSGSLFVGLFLAGLALAPAPGLSRSLAAVLAAPVLILGVPILDTTLVTIGRVLEGRPVSQGGRDHTSHRFVDIGLPERKTLWLLWGIAAAGGAIGVLLRSAERGTALLLGGVLVGTLTLVGAYLLATRLRRLEEQDADGLSLYRFLIRGHERYPLFALVLDAVWMALAYYAAYLIRWDPQELPGELPYFQRTITIYIGVKMIAFVLTGVYGTRWASFGLYDALRMARSNLLATLMAAGSLLLIERVGLSRGVVAIDLLVCMLLTIGARFSFRLIEGTARRLSEEGTPVVVIGPEDHVELATRQLGRFGEPRLRVVAVAVPEIAAVRGRLAGLPLYGGDSALRSALEETRAAGVVIVDHGANDPSLHTKVRAHLDEVGAVDVFSLEVRVRRVEGVGIGAGSS